MTHLATFAVLNLVVEIHARAWRAKRKLCKADKIGLVVRLAEQVEHRDDGHFERSRPNREGGTEKVFVL